MTTQVKHLETIIRRAPLGLRFQDLARNVPVTNGLDVQVWPIGDTMSQQGADRSPLSGIFGFHKLPGLRSYENGDRPATDWCGPGNGAPNFVVSIEDRLGRFLPQAMTLCLPRESVFEVPLFSAPARPPLPGVAAVRGELWNRVDDRPVAWALVTVTVTAATTYTGLSDERGMFVLFIPYANALPPLVGTPPHGEGPLDQLTWPLEVAVFYAPGQQQVVPRVTTPEIRSLLGQDRAELYDTEIVHGPTLMRALHFGQDLLLETTGLAPPDQSRLLVDPA